jgi:hypothetical protein
MTSGVKLVGGFGVEDDMMQRTEIKVLVHECTCCCASHFVLPDDEGELGWNWLDE